MAINVIINTVYYMCAYSLNIISIYTHVCSVFMYIRIDN